MTGGGPNLVIGAEPSLSLADVEKLLRNHDDPRIVKAFGHVFGVVVSLAPVWTGPPGFALWALLDVKDELVGGLTHLLPFLTRKRKESYLDRLQRMKIAVTALVYVAFVEEASHAVKKLVPRRDLEALGRPADHQAGPSIDLPDLVLRKPPVVGPLIDFNHYLGFAEATCIALFRQLVDQLSGYPGSAKLDAAGFDGQVLARRALDRLEAAFVELCANHDELLLWAQCDTMLRGNARLGERLRDVAVGQDRLDLGLARLQQLTTQVVSATETQVPRVVDAIHRAYADDLTSSISVTDERPATEGFSYPTKGSAFIPQRFACVQQDAGKPIHDEQFWAQKPVDDDVGVFLLRSFMAADRSTRPVLILGHPGSGKSLLSEMLAARLTPPFFTTIRVSLRDTDGTKEIEDQIEDAICKATGHKVSWIELSEMAEAPPIVIFDGLDELLLATGNSHVAFLERLAQFQRREFVQRRPVRIVVTSRLTLIHRMRVADGTYIIRLLDFSPEQQQTWIDIWNGRNEPYFTTHQLERFTLPDDALVQELGVQPLLLLMLAIYDADENGLAATAASSRAELYESIVEKFIERQRSKAATTGGAFRSLPAAKRAEVVAQDMQRLSIVALAMHKRAQLHVTSDELDADLAAYGMGTEADPADLFALTSAEALLGEFFFVHRSETEVDRESTGRSHAFEFLHNTFGEFLLAMLIAKRLAERCRALQAAASWPEASEIPRMEAAAAELLDDLRDALHWQLLCVRPVVLEMLGDLLARPRVAQDLTTANDLVARELCKCTSGDDPRELQLRAVECANLLSIVTQLPEDLRVVECDERRWQQIVGLLRGSLTFEEMTQLVSSVETVVRVGSVGIHPATVALSPSDIPGAVHRAARVLGDWALLRTTQLATADSLVSVTNWISEAIISDEEHLLASRILRPAIWRRMDEDTRQLLVDRLEHGARFGMDRYPNTAIAALNTAWRFGHTTPAYVDLPFVLIRSLGEAVEPELFADFIFSVEKEFVDWEGLRRSVVDSLHQAIDATGEKGPVGRMTDDEALRLDRILIGLCTVICGHEVLTHGERQLVRDEVLTDDLFGRIANQAPSFAWLPAAAWLTFSPSMPNEAWLANEEARVAHPDVLVLFETEIAVLRALSCLLPDPRRLKSTADRLLRVVVSEDALINICEQDAHDELRAGWSYLDRAAAAAHGSRLLPFGERVRAVIEHVPDD